MAEAPAAQQASGLGKQLSSDVHLSTPSVGNWSLKMAARVRSGMVRYEDL